MKYKFTEYILDISFNDTSDRMVIVTTSQNVIIFKKILKNSEQLIDLTQFEGKKKDQSDINMSNKYIFNFEDDEEESELSDLSNNFKDNIKEKTFKRSHNSLHKSVFYGIKTKLDLNELNLKNNLFQKNKEFKYIWELQEKMFVDGPVLRVVWANSELGHIFACSGYNKWIYIFQEEKGEKKLIWNYMKIVRFSAPVIDLCFFPKINSLQLASITSDGHLQILKSTISWKDWDTNELAYVSKNGCTCLCCNPSDLDEKTIVIGCKKNKEEKNSINKDNNNINKNNKTLSLNKTLGGSGNKNLLKLVWFKDNNKGIIQSINDCSHEDDITDVDWSNQNGRSYHMICSTSKDGKFIIWEINLFQEKNDTNNFFNHKKIFEFIHSKPFWRCCFNESGIIASCIDEDGDTFTFLKTGKNKFVKLDINKKINK